MSAGAGACREAAAAREVRPRCLRRLHRSWALGAHGLMPRRGGRFLGHVEELPCTVLWSQVVVCMVSSGLAVSIHRIIIALNYAMMLRDASRDAEGRGRAPRRADVSATVAGNHEVITVH